MSAFPDVPYVACLCPTYGRPPHLIANTIKCFLDQDYADDRRELLIYDDLGNLSIDDALRQRGVWLTSFDDRSASLPDKYNTMRRLAAISHIQLIWEDDELYLPHHISSYAAVLKTFQWAHPEEVWSTYTGSPEIEKSGGRFHAALGFRTKFLDSIKGWPHTNEPHFDQQLIAVASNTAVPGRPDQSDKGPSYVFRWNDTLATHGQSTMHAGADWYKVAKPQHTEKVHISLSDVCYDPAAIDTIQKIQLINSLAG